MGWKNKIDTPEAAKIRDKINGMMLTGLSPRMVLENPVTKVEPLVLTGITNFELGRQLGINQVAAGSLRKYYGLPSTVQVNEMLACIKTGEPEPEPELTACANCGEKHELKNMRAAAEDPFDFHCQECAETEESMDKFEAPVISSGQEQEYEPIVAYIHEPEEELEPLLDITTQAFLAAPLVSGIAKYLDRLDKETVEVVIVVTRNAQVVKGT